MFITRNLSNPNKYRMFVIFRSLFIDMFTNKYRLFQWVEESFTNFQKGINWRSYVVCDVAYKNVNNWLWTPFIDRGQANRIYIEIKFTIRDCSLFPGKFGKLTAQNLARICEFVGAGDLWSDDDNSNKAFGEDAPS